MDISLDDKRKKISLKLKKWYSNLTREQKLERNKRQREFWKTATQQQLEIRRQRNKRWYKTHPEVIHAKNRRIGSRFSFAKNHARRNGRDWNIPIEKFSEYLSKRCHYCEGCLPESGCALDRMDNKRGYILGNVVPCCINCNRIKRDLLTYEEMVVAMKAVLNLRISKISGDSNG